MSPARKKRSPKGTPSKEGLPPVQIKQELLFDEPPATQAAPPVQQPPEHNRAAHATLPKERGPLGELMDFNFLQFASYTICNRAIPTVEDGFKPVQRRIMHALHEKDDGRFIKVANIVGHTMQYHPHGDASIADALVNLTNKRYLIEGQGNFGNIYTGDSAAASRYIECRLTGLARNEIFNKKLTEYIPSYDGRNKEPVLLPSKLPLLLMLGAEGIAVGLTTKIFPHNFGEVIEALIAAIQKKPFALLPDFITGGLMDVSDYNNGHGRIRLRAKIEARDDNSVTITELPAGVTTEALTSSIEDAIRKKKVRVKAINDYTAGSVEIELKFPAGENQERIINSLFAFTLCETAVTGRFIVLHGNRPVEMTVPEFIKIHADNLVDLLKRELEIRRGELLDAFHNKTLVQIFVEERIYKKIEKCETYQAVQEAVLAGFRPFRDRLRRDVIADDVEMLLGIRIRRISLFDINKNRKEIEDVLKELELVGRNLKSIRRYTTRYLKRLLKDYAHLYPRRSIKREFKEIEVRKLTASELSIHYDKDDGYVGHAVRGGEELFNCSSLDKVILVWNDGRFRVSAPPDKFFVDKNLVYCARYDRSQLLTMIYSCAEYGFTYLKRFTFGGVILNKDYLCTPERSKVLHIQEGSPDLVYIKYRPAKGQRIHQQIFTPTDVAVKGVKARGIQMTSKKISAIATSKPRWWKDDDKTPRGIML